MSSIALRNRRTLTRKEAYTPSKVETNTAYKLNEKKALRKTIDASKRDLDVEIELKRGTLVITYTPAAYEIYKQAIYKYYDEYQHKTYERTTKLSRTDKNSIEKAISEESLSVKLKNNPNKDNRQQYRINMFNTTSRMDINGRYYQKFIYDDLPDIINMCDMREVSS